MRKRLLGLTICGLLGATAAQAQSVQATATLNVDDLLSVSLNTSTVAFSVPTATQFDAGFIAANAPITVTGRGNLAYRVSWSAVGTDATSLAHGTYNGRTGRADKPLAHLRYSTAGALANASSGASVPTSGTELVTGAAGDVVSQAVYFGMVLDWTDLPGSYTATLTYTIAAQ